MSTSSPRWCTIWDIFSRRAKCKWPFRRSAKQALLTTTTSRTGGAQTTASGASHWTMRRSSFGARQPLSSSNSTRTGAVFSRATSWRRSTPSLWRRASRRLTLSGSWTTLISIARARSG
eukprot:Amastigsp_a852539_140.p2 type:complete len:119 gc:universal Amastigsp_a852539_140:467-111(-)